jgi:hypothetical protein
MASNVKLKIKLNYKVPTNVTLMKRVTYSVPKNVASLNNLPI